MGSIQATIVGLTRPVLGRVARYGGLAWRRSTFDRTRGRAILELATPAMVTGGIFTVFRVVDFLMVSVALPDAAVAGLAFGFQYYFIGFTISIGLSSGTISLVSRFKGAGEDAMADFVVKQSLWFSLLLSTPMAILAWVYAEPLVGLLTNDPAAIGFGASYLSIVMLATICRFWSMVCAQGLSGCGDTRTPMVVSLITIPANIGLNAALIFGLGPFPELGIKGAAWGTVLASTLGATIFTAVYLSGRFALTLHPGGRQWDSDIATELVRIGTPMAATRLVDTIGRFPFLFVLATLGTPIVAAFAIGRRVFQFALIPAWGYGTAASTFVGQSLGAGDEPTATAYGWDAVRIAILTQVVLAAIMVVFARPIVELFGTTTVDLSVEFVWVFALGIAGFSIFQTLEGGLRGAGDTTWPLYGVIAGIGLRLGVAVLALPLTFVIIAGPIRLTPGIGAGLLAVYAAILVDWYVRAGVNAARFYGGRWQLVARRSSARARADDD